MIFNAIAFILVFPGGAYLLARRYADRTYTLSSEQRQLVYHPLTGKRLEKAVQNARLLILLPPVLLMSTFGFVLVFLTLTSNDDKMISIPGLVFLSAIVNVLVVLFSFLFTFLIAQVYLRRTCKRLALLNPDHRKALENLPNQLARNFRLFGRKIHG